MATSSTFSSQGNRHCTNSVLASERAVWKRWVISENMGIVSSGRICANCFDKYICDRQYALLRITSNVPIFSPSFSPDCNGPIVPKKRLSSICSSCRAVVCTKVRGLPVISSVTLMTDV